MDKPLVSFITPVYNTGKYLPECLESVLCQTSPEWEMILINDGSTDDSGKICNEYARKDSRIKVIHKTNSGQLPSRIIGIEKAKGLYCCGLDSDDYLEKECVEVLQRTIEQHPADIITWYMRAVDNDGKRISEPVLRGWSGAVEKTDYLEYVGRTGDHSFCNKLIRTDLISQSFYGSIPDSRRSVDYIQICPSVCMAESIYAIDDVLYDYRQVSGSVTHNMCGKHIIDILNSEKCIFEIVSHYGMLSKGFEDCEYQCLVRTVGYELKQSFRSGSINRLEARIIRKHPVFLALNKYEKSKFCSSDIVFIMRMFRYGMGFILKHIYGSRS